MIYIYGGRRKVYAVLIEIQYPYCESEKRKVLFPTFSKTGRRILGQEVVVG